MASDWRVGTGDYRLLCAAGLGVGYDTISDILNANLALKLLVVVMLAKAVALVISLGSGDIRRTARANVYVECSHGRGFRRGHR